MSIPTKAATAACQFVEADIARSAALKALRDAPECVRMGLVYDDGSVRRHRCKSPNPCDACKNRDRLHAKLKNAAYVRRLARLRAIRAVKGVL